MNEMLEVIINFITMTMIIVIAWGFLLNARNEAKGARWIRCKSRKPRRKFIEIKNEVKEGRFLVSRKNGDVVIATYNFENLTFSVPDVEAWREIPKSYHETVRIIAGVLRKVFFKGNRK